MKSLADYYDPNLPDSAIITVPNELLRELKEARAKAQAHRLQTADNSLTSPDTMGFPK